MLDLTQFEGHTPGPWDAETEEGGDPTGLVASWGEGCWIADVYHYPYRWKRAMNKASQWRANARLIAAAPELLHFLQQLRAEVERLNKREKALRIYHGQREADYQHYLKEWEKEAFGLHDERNEARKERDEARAENEKLRARVEVLESQRKSISKTCHCLRKELGAALDDDDDPPPVKAEPVAKGRITRNKPKETTMSKPLMLTNVRIAFLKGGTPEYRAEPVPDGDMSDARLAATRRVIAIAPTLYARVAVVVEMLEEARQSGDEANPYELLTDIEERLTKALSQ